VQVTRGGASDLRRESHGEERDHEDEQRVVYDIIHALRLPVVNRSIYRNLRTDKPSWAVESEAESESCVCRYLDGADCGGVPLNDL
jgi:hypothetical protein